MQTYMCIICGETLPVTEFSMSNRGRGKLHRCKTCVRKRSVECKHGITHDEIKAMFGAQNGRCAICGEPFLLGPAPDLKSRKDTAYVDHDHETGKVRGLLCQWCNTGLGFFRDTPEFLEEAAEYIRSHKENES